MRTWIKICANTTAEDALLAASGGADAVGFVFAESVRRVTPADVKRIVQQLPESIQKVGVFVNEPVEKVIAVTQDTGLTAVQLHGEETSDYIKRISDGLKERPTKIFKTFSAGRAEVNAIDLLPTMEENIDAFLIDSGNATMRGGTGQVFDWLKASDFVLRLKQHSRVIVAGGLNPENVTAAVRLFQPWGVDVATGVESQPGRKDPEKVRAFIAAVRVADKVQPANTK